MTSTLIRLEGKPQGAVFTGKVEIEAPATWAKFVLPESGAVIWRQVIGLEEAWWKEAGSSGILAA